MISRSIYAIFLLLFLIGCQKDQEQATARYTSVKNTLDAADRQSLNRESPRTVRRIDRNEPLSTDDVKRMAKAGLSNRVILHQIDATETIFYLTSADIVDLRRAGVSQKIIDKLMERWKSGKDSKSLDVALP